MEQCPSCKSTSIFVTEHHTRLCLDCGVEKACAFDIHPINVSYNCTHHQPFAEGYNRRKRFHTMLSNVILGACNVADDHMIKYLSGFTHYVEEACLLKQMKKSGLRDKRYTSLHLFSRIFLPSYVKPVLPSNWCVVEKSIMTMFSEIELIHHRLFCKPFFSYVWLLQKILGSHSLGFFSRYIKQLKCQRRVKVYEDDFTLIMTKLALQDRYVGARVCVSVFPKQLAEHKDDRCQHPGQTHHR